MKKTLLSLIVIALALSIVGCKEAEEVNETEAALNEAIETIDELHDTIGELQDTITEFEKSEVENAERNKEIWEDMESLIRKTEDKEVLERFYEKALDYYPEDTHYVHSLLNSYYMRGRRQYLLTLIKKVENESIVEALDLGYQLLGNLDKGRYDVIQFYFENESDLIASALEQFSGREWYFGRYDRNGKRSGLGVCFYGIGSGKGDIYCGEWEDGQRSGDGIALMNSYTEDGECEVDGTTYRATIKTSRVLRVSWENDLPNGEYEYWFKREDILDDEDIADEYDHCYTEHITGKIVNGKGEGETIASKDITEGKPVSIVTHFLDSGLPVEFEHPVFPGQKVKHVKEYNGEITAIECNPACGFFWGAERE
ncbi:hypothetical protein LJC01_01510 [Clostridiaceae bacterium OttesenSCG-928-D20]|nr:hypothetical protein [Clostridiaceae bacterium OttesenSCG-928-D20]